MVYYKSGHIDYSYSKTPLEQYNA